MSLNKIKQMLGTISAQRPRPDGLDFASRSIIPLEEAGNFTPPDRVSSFINARNIKLSPLARMVLNNLSISPLDSSNRENLAAIAQCQYKKFKRIYEECHENTENFEQDIEASGAIIDRAKKKLWTAITLNPTGLITNYELLLNGVQVGYLQFMEKARKSGEAGYVGKLEVETAFGIELPANSVQLTDLSIDPAKILWALNLNVLSAEKISNIEDEIEDGLLLFMCGLFYTVIENPKALFDNDVQNVCTVLHHRWAKKLSRLGILVNDNIINEAKYNGKYYALPMEFIRVVNFNSDQMKEATVKINFLKSEIKDEKPRKVATWR